MQALEPNKRVLPSLEQKVPEKGREDYTAERVLKAALPLLALYKPIGTLAQMGAIGCEVYEEAKSFECSVMKIKTTAFKIATVAALLLQPVITATVCHASQAVNHLYRVYRAESYTEKALELFKAAHQIVYIGTLHFLSAELLMVSFVAQAVLEGYRAYQFEQKEMTLEAIFQAAAAMIRGHFAYTQVDRVKRNWLGSKLTQAQFEQIIREHKWEEQTENSMLQTFIRSVFADDSVLDLERELARRNISNNIENLDLSFRRLYTYRMHDLTMKGCNFGHAKIIDGDFKNVIFIGNNWEKAKVIRTTFNDGIFEKCDLTSAAFNQCRFTDFHFLGSNLLEANFFGSVMNRVTFELSKLCEASFFGVKAKNCSIIDSDLSDTVMADASFELIRSIPQKNRKVIALEADLESESLHYVKEVEKALKDHDVVLLRYHYKGMNHDEHALKEEVDFWATEPSVIANHESSVSIPVSILTATTHNTEISGVRELAANIVNASDGIVIPGGADVNPIFYGKAASYRYLHDMLNFAVIKEALDQDKNVMGTCRGHQLINVIFGGTLRDLPFFHYGEQDLTIVEPDDDKVKQIATAIVSAPRVVGSSSHRQAIDKVGRGLHAFLEHEGVIKAMVHDSGRVIATQFHPEKYIEYRESTSSGISFWWWRNSSYTYSKANITTNANFYKYFLSDQGFITA